MELIKNNSGGLKLCLNGYMYTKKNTKKTSIRWECSQKRGLDCLGAVNTDIEVQTVHLCASNTWYMDGTHPPTPGLFRQLYVIRAPLGNTAVTCVYALLPGKSQEIYEELFQSLDQKCEEMGLTPDPTTVITDFEQAVLNAFRATFGDHVDHKGCFFHLTQNTWRCIQRLGLVERYKRDDEIKLYCGMLDALAFLPIEDVSEGMEFLKQTAPEEIEDVIAYFDKTYVSGTFRRIQQQDGQPIRVRRIQPLYPPTLWNVHQATLTNSDRTNNLCESWNQQFQKLLGYNHLTVWVAIEAFRKDQSVVETALFNNANGVPPKKRVKKSTTELQERLQNLCTDYVDRIKGMEEFLRAVGRTIRWKV